MEKGEWRMKINLTGDGGLKKVFAYTRTFEHLSLALENVSGLEARHTGEGF